jgi:IS1 family transposase
MNKLNRTQRAQVLGMMVEGMSIRSIVRLTGFSKNTVVKLLADAGEACGDYMDRAMVNLPCKRLQADEIWSFVYAKERNVPAAKRHVKSITKPNCDPKGGMVGSVWTWTAIDADTKLIPSFHVGTRDAWCAYHFMTDLAKRLSNRVQLTTDGHHAYLGAVYEGFGTEIDYAMLIKLYGPSPEGGPETRYSPPKCIGARPEVKQGAPDPEHISTSYAERSNLSMRMGMRRFTRLTNAFSKKCANHEHALAIYFTHYNFVRIHQTLRVTPAMAAGVSDRLWSLDDMAALVETREQSASDQVRKGWITRRTVN